MRTRLFLLIGLLVLGTTAILAPAVSADDGVYVCVVLHGFGTIEVWVSFGSYLQMFDVGVPPPHGPITSCLN